MKVSSRAKDNTAPRSALPNLLLLSKGAEQPEPDRIEPQAEEV